MDIEHTAESLAADELFNEQISEEPTETPEPVEGHSDRSQRVAEYEAAGLENPDPLEACLVAVNADLIRISFTLGTAIQQSLAAEPATAETVRRVEPALNNHLRVTRQIDRFAHLEVRTAEARREAARGQTKLQMMALQGRLGDTTSRSRRSIRGH